MERTQVADFYRGKGYLVHESIVVTGQSGNQQRVPLLCEGPLGNLAVFFGDAAGIDGPEIGAAKRVARDLGATAVVAAAAFSAQQRQAAAELGVVLLDAASVGMAPAPEVPSAWPGQTRREALDRDLAAHPWPASGRPGGTDARSPALLDIDDVLSDRAPQAPTATTPPRPAQSTEAAPPVPAPAAAPAASDAGAGGLWKHRRAPAAQASVAPTAAAPRGATPAAGRFAWLDLPKPAAPRAEAEYTGSVAARAPTQAAASPADEARERQERLVREAQLRVLVRRGAWIIGSGTLVYLFLLWWF